MELINLGAIPIDEDFDPDDAKKPIKSEQGSYSQNLMSCFDVLSFDSNKSEGK